MFELKLDIRDYGAMNQRIAGAREQMPWVLSNLLNDAAFKARQVWVNQTWPESITQRNSSFINAALRVEKATKQTLRVRLYDRLGRDYLQRLAKGGTQTPTKSDKLAIPLKAWIRYTSRGKASQMKLAAILANTPKQALRITEKGVFVGQGGRLNLRYSFRPRAVQPKMVPFYEDFEYIVRNTLRTGYADAMKRAMEPRK